MFFIKILSWSGYAYPPPAPFSKASSLASPTTHICRTQNTHFCTSFSALAHRSPSVLLQVLHHSKGHLCLPPGTTIADFTPVGITQEFNPGSATVQFCLTELLNVHIKETELQLSCKKSCCDQLCHSSDETQAICKRQDTSVEKSCLRTTFTTGKYRKMNYLIISITKRDIFFLASRL